MAFDIGEATSARVRELVRAKYHPFRSPETDRFVEHFRGIFGRSLRAVIFYGSCLSSVTRSTTSMYDFFLICDRYERFYGDAGGSWRARRRWLHTALNRVLAPNIYETDVPAGEALGGGALRCKYCVVSMRDLARETSPRANDLYHAGRFSKRMGIAFTATPRVLDAIVDRFAAASTTVASLAVGRIAARADPRAPFSGDDFCRAVLALSYEGEARVEASDKVEKIFRSEVGFYERLYAETVLPALIDARGRAPVAASRDGSDRSYRLAMDPAAARAAARESVQWIERSRRRGKQRWPKYMFMYENWIDYILEKIERTKGVKIRPTERDKRWWPIFGWKYFFEIRRAGLIR